MGAKRLTVKATCISVLSSKDYVFYTFKRGQNSYMIFVDDNPDGDLLIEDMEYSLTSPVGFATDTKDTIVDVFGKYILFGNGAKIISNDKADIVTVDYTDSFSPDKPIKILKDTKRLLLL